MVHLASQSVHVDDPPKEVSASTPSTIHDVVEGVPPEKVDSYTLQVIERIFPRPTSGVQFLALLLRLACIKQIAFSDTGGESKAAAVITVQSIRVLAHLIGWSYDTTQKYVLLFCALGLLVKRRHRNQIELYFPLERYQMTSAQLLDRIIAGEIKARPKVISFTKQVRRRYLVLLRESTTAFSAGQLPPPGQPAVLAPGSLPESTILLHVPTALDSIRTLLESTGVDSNMRHRLLQGIKQIFAQPDLVGGRLSGEMGDSEQPVQFREGRLSGLKGDFDSSIQSQPGRLFGSKGDSLLPPHTTQSRLSDTGVDFPEAASPLSRKLSPGKSSVLVQEAVQNGRLSGQPGDSQPKMVDSEGNTPANVNVSIHTIVNTLNVNVKGVIEYLRQAFDEPPGKRGYYYTLYNKNQYTCSDAWLAAAIETLVGIHQTHSVQDAGRYFFSRCAAHHQQGIPPEAAELVQRYGAFTYPQLLERLRTPAPPKDSAPSAYQTPVARTAPKRPTITLHIPRQQQHRGMSEKEMRELVRTIRGDERTCCFLVQPYHQADGTCALLVDDEMGHQTWVYSLREWRNRLTWMHHIPDLFTNATSRQSP